MLFVVVRGTRRRWTRPGELAERAGIALFAATGLPIIVAVTTIGLDDGELTRSTAAALVGAGMLSVLVFPLLALAVARRTRGG